MNMPAYRKPTIGIWEGPGKIGKIQKCTKQIGSRRSRSVLEKYKNRRPAVRNGPAATRAASYAYRIVLEVLVPDSRPSGRGWMPPSQMVPNGMTHRKSVECFVNLLESLSNPQPAGSPLNITWLDSEGPSYRSRGLNHQIRDWMVDPGYYPARSTSEGVGGLGNVEEMSGGTADQLAQQTALKISHSVLPSRTLKPQPVCFCWLYSFLILSLNWPT